MAEKEPVKTVQNKELRKAITAWALNHPNKDDVIVSIEDDIVTPRQLARHINARTPLGNLQIEAARRTYNGNIHQITEAFYRPLRERLSSHVKRTHSGKTDRKNRSAV